MSLDDVFNMACELFEGASLALVGGDPVAFADAARKHAAARDLFIHIANGGTVH